MVPLSGWGIWGSWWLVNSYRSQHHEGPVRAWPFVTMRPVMANARHRKNVMRIQTTLGSLPSPVTCPLFCSSMASSLQLWTSSTFLSPSRASNLGCWPLGAQGLHRCPTPGSLSSWAPKASIFSLSCSLFHHQITYLKQKYTIYTRFRIAILPRRNFNLKLHFFFFFF